MLDETAVRGLFRARLNTVQGVAGSVSAVVAWDQRDFQVPTLTTGDKLPLWIRETFTLLSENKSSTGLVEVVGETIYCVETPSGRGTEQADTLAKAIAEAFEPGQSLTNGTVAAILERTERRPYRPDAEYPAWSFKAIAIRWRSFTPATVSS